jgi:hypothetical protein
VRLHTEIIPDPPECICPGGVPLELLVEAPAAQTLGWILPAPTPFETAEKIAPQQAALLPPIYVQDKTQIMPGAGGALFANVIAPKPYVLPRYDQAMTVLAANQTFDSKYSIVGETPLPASVPEPNFAGRETPGPTAEIAPIAFPLKELALNYFRATSPVVEINEANGPYSVDFTQDNWLWFISGTTYDGTGAVLGNCNVTMYEPDWDYSGGEPYIRETISDGSGAYSIQAKYTNHQLTAYKNDATPLAGITRDSVVPGVVTNIYLRDATIPSPSPSGSGMSRARVVNP